MRILASLAITVALCHGAFAQPAPPPAPSSEAPQPEQQTEPPLAQPAPGLTIGPALPPPPSPEAPTPPNPLQPPPNVEVSPPATSPSAQPLPPATPPAPPLQQTARVSPEAAAYLQEIGIDPNAPDVVEVSQDKVGAYSLDSLAAGRDETKVRRFLYTRTFMHRFLADSDNLRIEPDKYDISFLTAEEVQLIADELNK
jgi:hypothetical protein